MSQNNPFVQSPFPFHLKTAGLWSDTAGYLSDAGKAFGDMAYNEGEWWNPVSRFRRYAPGMWNALRDEAYEGRQLLNPLAGIARGTDQVARGTDKAVNSAFEGDMRGMMTGALDGTLGAGQSLFSAAAPGMGKGVLTGTFKGGKKALGTLGRRSGILNKTKSVGPAIGRNVARNVKKDVSKFMGRTKPLYSNAYNHGTRAGFNVLSYLPRAKWMARPTRWGKGFSRPGTIVGERLGIAGSSLVSPMNAMFLADISERMQKRDRQWRPDDPMGEGTSWGLSLAQNAPFLLSRGMVPGMVWEGFDMKNTHDSHSNSNLAEYLRDQGYPESVVRSENPFTNTMHRMFWNSRKIPDVYNFSDSSYDKNTVPSSVDRQKARKNDRLFDVGTVYRDSRGDTFALGPEDEIKDLRSERFDNRAENLK